MSLAAGTRLGPYEIVAQIGAGGMGEVYRARDARLGRHVALKVLPPQFAEDPERLARFEREAKTLAALNHPHIAHIHGLEESGDQRALIMELVEGLTLAERIAHRAVPLDDVLPLATQLAEALEYAHEHGIIHRDLKPANIKITPDGTVKVLDFGLAKAMEGGPASADPANSPTITSPAMPFDFRSGHPEQGRGVTRAGVILGTAAYMSPEQARGATVDKRADIWAFGVVLYEMLAGRACFGGQTVTDVLAAVVRAEPDWSALPAETPWRVRDLLRRCLTKDAKQRLHDIGDARLEIEQATSAAGPAQGDGAPTPGIPAPAPSRPWRLTPWVLAAVASLAAAAAWVWRPAGAPAAGGADLPQMFSITPPPAHDLADSSYRTLAISADGRDIVLSVDRAGSRFLLRRPLASLDAVPVAGSEGGATLPFLSPDGASIGFWLPGLGIAAAPAAGGAVRVQCDAYTAWGAAWAADGAIIVGGLQGLTRCSPASTRPERLTSAGARGDTFGHQEPQALPDGRVLFVIEHISSTEEQRRVALLDTAGNVRELMRGVTSPRYVPPGDLLFVRGDVLYAIPVDPTTLAPRGPERRLVDRVALGEAYNHAYYRHARYDVSFRGPLVYQPDQVRSESELAWVERSGAVRPLPAPRQDYRSAALSPDGRQVAVSIQTGAGREVWVYGAGSDAGVRVAFGAAHANPSWMHDGRRLLFASSHGGPWTLHTAAADGSGAPSPVGGITRLYVVGTEASELSGGQGLVFSANDEDGLGLFMLRAGAADLTRLSPPRVVETRPAVSPDGRWMAYIARDTGGLQLYVRDLPGSTKKSRVSMEGASLARWARDGRTLYFQAGRQIMAAASPSQAGVEASRPTVAAEIPGLIYFDVAPDGRFLVIRRVSTPPPPQFVVIPNWRALLAEPR